MFSKFIQKAAWLKLESFYKGRVLTFIIMLCLCLPYLTIQTKRCYALQDDDWLKYWGLPFSSVNANKSQNQYVNLMNQHLQNMVPLQYSYWGQVTPGAMNNSVVYLNDPSAIATTAFYRTDINNNINSFGFGQHTTLQGLFGELNQFNGPRSYPYSSSGSFSGQNYDSFNAGPGFSGQNPIFPIILGYQPPSQYNVGATTMMHYQNIFSPPSSLNSGVSFYGSGYLARNGPQSVNGNMLGLQAENTLASRYHEIEKQQLDFYYTDPDLRYLRIEANYNYMYYSYTDPWYLYHSYEQLYSCNTISSMQPIYPSLTNLSWEIASWTSPPNDIQTLKDRFNKRLLLTSYNAELGYETQYYFSLYPDQQTYLLYTKSTIDQIIQKNWGTTDVTTWAAEWDNRFQSIHENSETFAIVQEEMAELFDDFPAFEEYLRLNSDVVSLIPDLTDYASVKRTQGKLTEVLSDPDTSKKFQIITIHTRIKFQPSWKQQMSRPRWNAFMSRQMDY